jgi:hypothetical protein
MYTWLLFIFAIVVLILIPFTPQLIRLRIRFFRWLHWNWAVNLLESHFQRLGDAPAPDFNDVFWSHLMVATGG